MDEHMQESTFIPRPANPLGGTEATSTSDFTADLENALEELQKAVESKDKVNAGLKTLQGELNNRGWWDTVGATFSGKTDKELANIVEGFGTSLQLTQNVVRVILTVSTQKNQALHQFNAALVDKISAIQGDTHTLNANQKKVTLHFLGELKSQIDEQIRHYTLVESHDARLDAFDAWQEGAHGDIGTLRTHVDTISSELDRAHANAQSMATSLLGELTQARETIVTLTSRVDVLEQEHARTRSFGSLIARNVPSLVALAMGVAALVTALH
jgi:hypothetical protein